MTTPSTDEPTPHAGGRAEASPGSPPAPAPASGADGPAGPSEPRATEVPAATTPGTAPGNDAQPLAPQPRRKDLSSFEVAAVVAELQILVGGYLDKAYQPTRDEVLLRFRAKGLGRRDLFIRRGSFACLTEHTPENPVRPPGFAMALRKYVCGGRIAAVEQAGFDRVFTIHIDRRDGTYRLVTELFGDGNCVLVRPDGKIVVPLVPESWAARTIRSGHPYEAPPAGPDPLVLDRDTFVAMAKEGNRDLVRALAINVGFGGAIAEELVLRTGLRKDVPIEEASDDDLERLFATWDELRGSLREGRLRAGLLHRDGRAVDVTVDRSMRFEAKGAKPMNAGEPVPAEGDWIEPMETFCAALDRLHLSGRQATERLATVKVVEERATKLQRQLAAQRAAIEKFEREAAEKAIEGETIFAHYATVERVLENLREARKTLDWAAIEERLEAGRAAGNEDAMLIVGLAPDRATVTVRLDDVNGTPHDIPLDIRESVSDNANAAYERGKKARDKLAGARVALEDTEKKAAAEAARHEDATAAVDAAMVQSSVLVPATRHYWFEGFRWFFASTGELIVGGRDAGSNDRVVKKHLEDGDRYVHADLHGAPSTVVKAFDGAVRERALEEAAACAITFSRAFGRFGSGDAYWVTPPQVSKTPQAGEFLARGAFIVRGERNWFRKLPLEASVGLVRLDGQGRPLPVASAETGATDGDADDAPAKPGSTKIRDKLMSGPPRAVEAWSETWIRVGPGDGARKRFVQAFARALSVAPDVVDRGLPVGDLTILGFKGLDAEAQAALEGLPGGPEPGAPAAEADA